MDAWTEKLDLYIDGELSQADERAVAEHLQQCPACASDIAARLLLKRQVRSAGRRYVPDAAFAERTRQMLAPKARFPFRRWKWMVSFALVLLLAVLIGIWTMPRKTPAEFADLHVTALANANPVDVVSSDRHTVKPWFQGKIPFTFNLPEVEGSGYTLLGGRLVFVNQSPAAQLIYQARQHRVSVFILQSRDAPALPRGLRRDHTFTTETWEANGLRYVIVTDADQAEIVKLIQLLRAAG